MSGSAAVVLAAVRRVVASQRRGGQLMRRRMLESSPSTFAYEGRCWRLSGDRRTRGGEARSKGNKFGGCCGVILRPTIQIKMGGARKGRMEEEAGGWKKSWAVIERSIALDCRFRKTTGRRKNDEEEWECSWERRLTANQKGKKRSLEKSFTEEEQVRNILQVMHKDWSITTTVIKKLKTLPRRRPMNYSKYYWFMNPR